ncbi:MAG: ABC transporter permease, partial [Gemmatimonadales bacterium]
PPSLDQLQIVVRDRSLDRESVRRIANEVRDIARRAGHRVRSVDVPEPGRHIHAAQINSLLMTQGIFGVLALLLSGFLVINLITAMLAGQVREIGVMKTLGASPSQLAFMYLGLAFALGVIACTIAIPLGLIIGRWYAGFTSTMLNFDTDGFDVPGWSIAIQLVAGIVLPLVAAAIPVIRGSRMPVSEALRDFGITSSDDDRLMRRIDGFGRPVLLALRNSLRKRQRTILTLTTLALGGAVYVGALNLRSSIRASVGYLYGEINRFDITVRFAEPHAADSITSLVRSVSGVERAEAWETRRAAVVMAGGELGGGFPLVGLAPDSKMVAYPVMSGRWLKQGDKNVIVVGRRLAEEDPTLAVGREIPLVVDGKEATWRVIGIVASGPAPVAATTIEAVPGGGTRRVDLAVVRTTTRDGIEQGAVSRRLRQDLENRGFAVSSVQLSEENRRVIEDHLLLVAGFLLVMSQAMIIVGGLGLASTMSLAVLERTREIGVMRAIGAKHSTILAMFQVEALAMSIVGWAIAIPLSLPASIIIGKVFGRIMFPLPVSFVPDLRAVVNWLVVVIVVSIVACAWPAYRATRITTAKALSYE